MMIRFLSGYSSRAWTISIILSAPNPVGFILLANVKGRFFSKSTIIGSILKYFLPKNWKIVIRLGTTEETTIPLTFLISIPLNFEIFLK